MMQTTINITHFGETIDSNAIKAAFEWIAKQMLAVDLENCEQVAVKTKLGESTQIDFNMSRQEEAQVTQPQP